MMNWNSEQLAALFELVEERVAQIRERREAERKEHEAWLESTRAAREAEAAEADVRRAAEWERQFGTETRDFLCRNSRVPLSEEELAAPLTPPAWFHE